MVVVDNGVVNFVLICQVYVGIFSPDHGSNTGTSIDTAYLDSRQRVIAGPCLKGSRETVQEPCQYDSAGFRPRDPTSGT